MSAATPFPRSRRIAGGRALLALALAMLSPVAPAQADTPDKGSLRGAQTRHLQVEGTPRSYLVMVPGEPVGAAALRPVVIVLHGGTQTAEQVWTQTSLPTLGASEGFIVAAPQGLKRHWNDGRGSTVSRDGPSRADDVAFLRALIADLVRRDAADPHAVFLVGVSNGGFMTMRFACEAADALRAAASVIANMPRDAVGSCHPSRPVPWLAINGTDDPIIPFAGQSEDTVRGGQRQPALLSADATFEFWARQAQCAPGATVQRIGQAELRVRGGCAGGTHSTQIVLHGAGHVAPGLPLHTHLVERVLGKPNLDIDAGSVIWQHFRATLAARPAAVASGPGS